MAWESFLEQALISYMIGESSVSGRAPTRYVFPQSDAHCGSILIGTQKYVDWANPEIVRKLTGLYLDQGDPIAPAIASIQTEREHSQFVTHCKASIGAAQASCASSFQRWAL